MGGSHQIRVTNAHTNERKADPEPAHLAMIPIDLIAGNAQFRPAVVSFVLDNSVTLAWCFEDERTDRLGQPLASPDQALRAAANELGLAVLG